MFVCVSSTVVNILYIVNPEKVVISTIPWKKGEGESIGFNAISLQMRVKAQIIANFLMSVSTILHGIADIWIGKYVNHMTIILLSCY